MVSAPWSSRAYGALTGPVEFVTAATVTTAAGLPLGTLDLVSGSVTFDEQWSPYIQANVTAVAPEFFIEPRIIPRLVISAGYVYADGTRDVWPLANLSITQAEVDELARTITLTAKSDEALVMGSGQYLGTPIMNTYNSYGLGIVNAVIAALAGVTGYSYVNNLTHLTGPSMTNYEYQPGDSWWSHIMSMRDMANGVVYCDENRVWRIDPYRTDESPELDVITTGDAPVSWPEPAYTWSLPILTGHQVTRDRESWGNTVILENRWTGVTDGLARVRRGVASVTTGPYATGAVGVRLHHQARSGPITQAEIDTAAANVLYRVHRLGETRQFTARAAYWLRPRALHRMWLSGVDAYFRITRVTYQLDGTGLMALTVRAPTPDPVGG